MFPSYLPHNAERKLTRMNAKLPASRLGNDVLAVAQRCDPQRCARRIDVVLKLIPIGAEQVDAQGIAERSGCPVRRVPLSRTSPGDVDLSAPAVQALPAAGDAQQRASGASSSADHLDYQACHRRRGLRKNPKVQGGDSLRTACALKALTAAIRPRCGPRRSWASTRSSRALLLRPEPPVVDRAGGATRVVQRQSTPRRRSRDAAGASVITRGGGGAVGSVPEPPWRGGPSIPHAADLARFRFGERQVRAPRDPTAREHYYPRCRGLPGDQVGCSPLPHASSQQPARAYARCLMWSAGTPPGGGRWSPGVTSGGGGGVAFAAPGHSDVIGEILTSPRRAEPTSCGRVTILGRIGLCRLALSRSAPEPAADSGSYRGTGPRCAINRQQRLAAVGGGHRRPIARL